MDVKSYFFFYVLLSLFLSGCSKSESDSSVVNLDFTRNYDGVTLNLNDIASDISVVRMETNENSLISYYRGFVGDKYILSFGNKSIMLFSSDGKFIQTIINRGKGPGEFNQIDAWTVDDTEHFLYYHDAGKDYICRYDLSSRKPDKELPFTNKGYLSKMLLINDTTFAIMPGMFGKYGYHWFYQSISGKILGGEEKESVPHPGGVWAGMSPLFIKLAYNTIFYQPSESDTLFRIKGVEKTPVFCFKYAPAKKNGSKTTGESVSILKTLKSRMLIRKSKFEKIVTSTSASIKGLGLDIYITDYSGSKINRIDSVFYDKMGIWLDANLIQLTNDNMVTFIYNAVDFKTVLKNAINSKDISDVKRNSLSILNNEISDDDNPIVIAGKLK